MLYQSAEIKYIKTNFSFHTFSGYLVGWKLELATLAWMCVYDMYPIHSNCIENIYVSVQNTKSASAEWCSLSAWLASSPHAVLLGCDSWIHILCTSYTEIAKHMDSGAARCFPQCLRSNIPIQFLAVAIKRALHFCFEIIYHKVTCQLTWWQWKNQYPGLSVRNLTTIYPCAGMMIVSFSGGSSRFNSGCPFFQRGREHRSLLQAKSSVGDSIRPVVLLAVKYPVCEENKI